MSAPTPIELFTSQDLEHIVDAKKSQYLVDALASRIQFYKNGTDDASLKASIVDTLEKITPDKRERLIGLVILQNNRRVCSANPPYGLLVLLEHTTNQAARLHVIRYVALAFMLSSRYAMEDNPFAELPVPGRWFFDFMWQYAQHTSADESLHIDELLRGAFDVVGDNLSLKDPFADKLLYDQRPRLERYAEVWLVPTKSHFSDIRRDATEIRRIWWNKVGGDVAYHHFEALREVVKGGAPEWQIKPRAANGRHHTPATRSRPDSYQQVRPTMRYRTKPGRSSRDGRVKRLKAVCLYSYLGFVKHCSIIIIKHG